MLGADRSLVDVLFSLTPRRIATRKSSTSLLSVSSRSSGRGRRSHSHIRPPGCGGGSGGSEPSLRCWASQEPDLGDRGPLQPGDNGVVGGLSGVRGVFPSSDAALLGKPGWSGTVGVFTGIMGGLMGMGPRLRPPEGRLRFGLEEGVRRMVATPGVMMEEGLQGSPAVEAGRLDWNMRR